MEAIYAGLTAWGIEITLAVLMICLLRREEKKCIARRVKDD
jgi:hypothetical protein